MSEPLAADKYRDLPGWAADFCLIHEAHNQGDGFTIHSVRVGVRVDAVSCSCGVTRYRP